MSINIFTHMHGYSHRSIPSSYALHFVHCDKYNEKLQNIT